MENPTIQGVINLQAFCAAKDFPLTICRKVKYTVEFGSPYVSIHPHDSGEIFDLDMAFAKNPAMMITNFCLADSEGLYEMRFATITIVHIPLFGNGSILSGSEDLPRANSFTIMQAYASKTAERGMEYLAWFDKYQAEMRKMSMAKPSVWELLKALFIPVRSASKPVSP